MNSRERVLAMVEGRQVDRLPLMPITMMFAAQHIGVPYGRYALDHRVLAEAQLTTAERFGFDHVSAITETREARDCGAAIRYFDDQPYAVDESQSRLQDKGELAGMRPPDPCEAEAMGDRLLAIRLLRRQVGNSKIVEGWVEGPCTAAADLRGINRLMLDFHDDTGFVRELFEFVLALAGRFGKAQAEAGADVVGIGDPTASLTGPRIYREFTWSFQKRLVDALHAAGTKVRLHICGNTRTILCDMAKLGADIVDVDSVVPMAGARAGLGERTVLLGGIDPVRVLRNGSAADVKREVARCIQEAGFRYVAGAGCEVPVGTPAANMDALANGAYQDREVA
jgi:MtaA/CmuA family methyltransferase